MTLDNQFLSLIHALDEVVSTGIQEELLLRELLPSPSSKADQQEGMHHTHSDEQWLVSSETKKTQTDHSTELQALQEQLQLQRLLQEQLSTQLQQERQATEDLRGMLKEQQQANKNLQHQLEASHVEAEEFQCQLDVVHQEVEEARECAQLQELLTQQMQAQLQEVTQQKGEYDQLSQQHEASLGRSHSQQVSSQPSQLCV